MQYMLMFYETADDMARRDDARAPEYFAGWQAYLKALSASGVVVSGAGLKLPATATSLRLRGDKRLVQDGPFADSKEQLGGFFVIDVPNLDSALEWAARCPCASSGGVEIRPTMTPPPS